MKTIKVTTQFEKDFKLVQKRGLKLSLLQNVIQILIDGYALPSKYKDHSLSDDMPVCEKTTYNPIGC